jgi:hypothetical protein
VKTFEIRLDSEVQYKKLAKTMQSYANRGSERYRDRQKPCTGKDQE